VGLVVVVVGILAEDDDFDGVEGGVAGPWLGVVSRVICLCGLRGRKC
jgi:hypothetical protein